MTTKPKSIRVPSLAEAIGPFSRAIQVGETLYISGTSAISHISGPGHSRKPEGDIEAQTRKTLENIRAVVEAAGGTMADIVKVTCFLKNQADYQRMNALRAEVFTSDPPPASSTIVCDLLLPEMLIEIEAIAILRKA
jgi:2-iminobutanoate/2-iminopropanoate deaminase